MYAQNYDFLMSKFLSFVASILVTLAQRCSYQDTRDSILPHLLQSCQASSHHKISYHRTLQKQKHQHQQIIASAPCLEEGQLTSVREGENNTYCSQQKKTTKEQLHLLLFLSFLFTVTTSSISL